MKTYRVAAVSILAFIGLASCSDSNSIADTGPASVVAPQPVGEGGNGIPETGDILVPVARGLPFSGIITMDGDRFAGIPGSCAYRSVELAAVNPENGKYSVIYEMISKKVDRSSGIMNHAQEDAVKLCGSTDRDSLLISGPARPFSPDFTKHAAVKGNSVGWVGLDATYHEVVSVRSSANQFDQSNSVDVSDPWFDRHGNFYYLRQVDNQAGSIVRVATDGATTTTSAESGVHLDNAGVPVPGPGGSCLGSDLAWLNDSEVVTIDLKRAPAAARSNSTCDNEYTVDRGTDAEPVIAADVDATMVHGASVSPDGNSLAFGLEGSGIDGGDQVYIADLDQVAKPELVYSDESKSMTVVDWVRN